MEFFFVPENNTRINLTDDIFEIGAYGVPSKSQNPAVLGQGGSSSTQCSNPSWTCRLRCGNVVPDGTNWQLAPYCYITNEWCQRHAQLGFEHWVLDGPP